MPDVNSTPFANFLEGWMVRQQDYLDQLISSTQRQQEAPPNEAEMRALVARVLLHYQQYYDAKLRATRMDVFIMFSPPWFTNYERAFLWIAGFKPGILFGIVTHAVGCDLSEIQVRQLERFKEEIRAGERQLSTDFARVQESVAEARLVQLALNEEGRVDGDWSDVDAALRRGRNAMKVLVTAADLLRTATARVIVEILSSSQAIKFLASVAQFQLRIRTYGIRRQHQPGPSDQPTSPH